MSDIKEKNNLYLALVVLSFLSSNQNRRFPDCEYIIFSAIPFGNIKLEIINKSIAMVYVKDNEKFVPNYGVTRVLKDLNFDLTIKLTW